MLMLYVILKITDPTSHQQNKDMSTSILHAERGGAGRPRKCSDSKYV